MLLQKAYLHRLTCVIMCFWCWSLPHLSVSLNIIKSPMTQALSSRHMDDMSNTGSVKEASTLNTNLNTEHITMSEPEVAQPKGTPKGLNGGDSFNDSVHELTESEAREMRLTMFQHAFTELVRANNINVSQIIGSKKELPHYPEALLDQMFKHSEYEEDFEDDFFAKDEAVIISGENIGHDCIEMNDTFLGCYTFVLKELMNSRSSIHSAKLWFYKNKDEHKYELLLYDLGSNTRGHPAENSIIFSSESDSKDNWVAMDVTDQATKWKEEGRDSRTLAFQCHTCKIKHPRDLYRTEFLVIKYSESKKKRRRSRRSREKCNFKKECCYRHLLADLKYVTAASGFVNLKALDIGYCFGHCQKTFTITMDHGYWVQTLPGLPEDKVRWLRKKRLPCCAPTKMMPVALKQQKDRGVLIERVFDDMIVKTCGCVI